MQLTPSQHQFYEVKISKEQMPTFDAYGWLIDRYGKPGPGGEWDWIIDNTSRIFLFKNKQDMSWFMLRWL
jgi:hypothetical protein